MIEELKKLIQKNELQQKSISKISGIPEANLSRILNGKANPTLKTFNKINDAIIRLSYD